MQRVVNSLTDLVGSGSRGQRIALDANSAAAWRDAEIINVREYGILGNSTNEATAINALFAAIKAGTTKRKRVIFPEPQNGAYYRVDAAIKPDQDQISIEGSGRGNVILRQYTANTPTILFDDDGSSGKFHIAFRHLGIENNTLPDATTTQQYGIQFRANADGTKISGNGYFLMDFSNLAIKQTYVGIGVYSTSTGHCPFWSSAFERIWFRDTQHNAVKLTDEPGSGSIGKPHTTFNHIDVLNYNTSVLSDGEAFRFQSCTGVVMNNINVEDWQNEILYSSGGSYFVLNGLRTERHDITKNGGVNILFLSDGQFILNGVDFQNLRIAHTSGSARLIRAVTGTAKVIVNGAVATRDAANSTSTGTTTLLWAPAGSEVYADGVSGGTNVSVFLGSANGDGQYGLVRLNGTPPAWDVAPTASSTYRGRRYLAQGAAGVADVEYACLKDSANAYNWKAAVSG